MHESKKNECKGKFQIFSFNTHLWGIEDIHVSYANPEDKFRVGSLLNESLHWVVFSRDKKVSVILAFDMIQRSFSEIPLLDHFTMGRYEVYSLRVIKGCLSVCFLVQDIAITEIWVMKECKVQSSWTKSIVISTHGIRTIVFLPYASPKMVRFLDQM